jgi:hypothetical protein
MTKRRDLAKGFQLETPDLWLSWDTTAAQLLEAFTKQRQVAPRLVAPGYYVARCHVLGGLGAQVGFHFEPKNDAGLLKELELFDNGERDIERSYQVFHERLVQLFGEPNEEKRSACGGSMPDREWHVGSVSIVHYVMDRFGPEEHLIVRRERSAFRAGRRAGRAFVLGLLALIYLWWSRVWQP